MNLKKIVYLSEAQFETLKANGSITVGDVTVSLDDETLYLTPQEETKKMYGHFYQFAYQDENGATWYFCVYFNSSSATAVAADLASCAMYALNGVITRNIEEDAIGSLHFTGETVLRGVLDVAGSVEARTINFATWTELTGRHEFIIREI